MLSCFFSCIPIYGGNSVKKGLKLAIYVVKYTTPTMVIGNISENIWVNQSLSVPSVVKDVVIRTHWTDT